MLKGPDAFRSISEASTEIGVPQHVLRFWETKFSFIRPMKRAGGRRFYRRQDLEVLRGVRALLHQEGYTIKGVQRLHKEKGLGRLMAAAGGEIDAATLAELDTPDLSPPDLEGLDAEAAQAGGLEPLTSDPMSTGLDARTRARLEAVLEELRSAKERLDALLAGAPAADS